MAEKLAAVENFLTCCVCLETFKEPVTLSCNHSFCCSCLKNYWDKNNTRNCPICRRRHSRDSPVNFALKELTLSFSKKNPLQTEEGEMVVSDKQPQTEPGQDKGLCNENPHTEEEVCSKHPQVPFLFCLDEARALCPACEFTQHRDHTVVSVEDAESQLKEQLKLELKPLTEQRDQASALARQYEEVRSHSQRQLEGCARQIRAEFERLHQILQREEELRLRTLREEQSRQAQTMGPELKKVRQLLSSLNQNISTVKQQLKRERMDFIREYRHIPKAPSTVLAQLKQRLGPGLLINQAKVLENLGFCAWEKMKSQVHYSPIILDPNSANGWLYLSEDLSRVRNGDTEYQQVPDNPERFINSPSVLGSEGWSSGSHLWDVEVGDHPRWNIGVAKESVERKRDTAVSLEHGVWCLGLNAGHYKDVVGKKLKLKRIPQKVQVHVDFDKGKVSFYNADDLSLICSHKERFKEKLFPYFSVGEAGAAETKEITVHSSTVQLVQ